MANLIRIIGKTITLMAIILMVVGLTINLSCAIIPLAIVGGIMGSMVWVEGYKANEEMKVMPIRNWRV